MEGEQAGGPVRDSRRLTEASRQLVQRAREQVEVARARLDRARNVRQVLMLLRALAERRRRR